MQVYFGKTKEMVCTLRPPAELVLVKLPDSWWMYVWALCSENLYLLCISCYWTCVRFCVRLVRIVSWKPIFCDYAVFFLVEWLCKRTPQFCISFIVAVDRSTLVLDWNVNIVVYFLLLIFFGQDLEHFINGKCF